MSDFDTILEIIRSRSNESGLSEKEEVIEIIDNLKEYYKLWKY